MKREHDTLCWTCQKAAGKCSWSKNFTPVEGWVAIPTKIQDGKKYKTKEPRYLHSFDVYRCPEFEQLEAHQCNLSEKDFLGIEETEYAEIKKLRKDGKLYKEIAGILGFSERTMWNKMRRYKVKYK